MRSTTKCQYFDGVGTCGTKTRANSQIRTTLRENPGILTNKKKQLCNYAYPNMHLYAFIQTTKNSGVGIFLNNFLFFCAG